MKILQINSWTGRIKDGLSRFIAEGEYDVVCIQEAIWSDDCNDYLELYVDTVDKLARMAGFDYVFKTPNYGVKALSGDTKFEIGNAILSKIPFVDTKSKTLIGEYVALGSVEDSKNRAIYDCWTAQKVVLSDELAIVNYHGYWQKDPLGNETSVECMRKVADLIKDDYRPTIMCGDLNVVAESPAMRELDFMQDLTAINRVKTTLRNVRFVKDVACDHILITNELNCKSFNLINAAVSDHQALVAEIE